MMLRLILILLNLFGYRTVTPVRLEKKMTAGEKINRWFQAHQSELLLVLIIAMMITLVLAMVMFFPAMDIWNNRFEEVVL